MSGLVSRRLQWSHGRLTVVTSSVGPGGPAGALASMEPRSFNRGDIPYRLDGLRSALLQWSHGRLTVVTNLIKLTLDREIELQWSHGRLTVVTSCAYR